jgi:hypothetical protein
VSSLHRRSLQQLGQESVYTALEVDLYASSEYLAEQFEDVFDQLGCSLVEYIHDNGTVFAEDVRGVEGIGFADRAQHSHTLETGRPVALKMGV